MLHAERAVKRRVLLRVSIEANGAAVHEWVGLLRARVSVREQSRRQCAPLPVSPMSAARTQQPPVYSDIRFGGFPGLQQALEEARNACAVLGDLLKTATVGHVMFASEVTELHRQWEAQRDATENAMLHLSMAATGVLKPY